MSIKIKFFEITAPFYEMIHFSGKKKIIKSVKKEKFFNQKDRVLDLAGGTGRIAKILSWQVDEMIVLDASEEMLKQCRKKGIKCKFGVVEKIPFPDNSFDKMLIIDAFHHFQDQAQAIKEIKRVLKDGGSIFVEEINPRSFGGFILKIAEKILLMGSRFHSPKRLKEIFEKNGFKVEIVGCQHSFYNLIIRK